MLIDERMKELKELGGNMCLADIRRHLLEVQRQTAKDSVELIQDMTTYLQEWALFDGKEMTAKEFADKVSRDILNTFLL